MRVSSSGRPRGRARLGVALLACGCALTACASQPAGTPSATESSRVETPTAPAAQAAVTEDYLPGLAAQVRLPAESGPAPLIVLVPGGGWASADPTGLIPLAEQLTAEGATTSLITYSTTDGGSTYPTAVDDVACAVRWSAQKAEASGHPSSRTIVLGHSAGGHLAALVGLSGSAFGGACPYPPVAVDGLIGMAGIYDTDQVQPVLSEWMGVSPADDPEAWQMVNPLTWVRRAADASPDLRVLLLHGDADYVVPVDQTTGFAKSLKAAQLDTTTVILPGLGHLDLFEEPNAEPPIKAWLDAWE